jgi:hypothetical protein
MTPSTEYDETRHSIRLLGQAALVRKLAGTGRPMLTRSKRKTKEPSVSFANNEEIPTEPIPDRSAIPPSAIPESGIRSKDDSPYTNGATPEGGGTTVW